MKNRFRIEYHRSGIIFDPEYAGTVKGAVNVARKHNQGPEYRRPIYSAIYERAGGAGRYIRWEKVAEVHADKIVTEDYQSRPSYKEAQQQMANARAVMESTYSVMAALNGIADKESKPCR